MADIISQIKLPDNKVYNIKDNQPVVKDIPNTPCDIATFSDGSNLPMPSLKVGIEPIQEGSGDPSPTNVRPISGWDEGNVSVSPLNIASLYNGQIYGDGSWVSSNMRLTNVSSGQDNSYFLKAGTYTLDYDKLNSNAPSLLQCSALTKDDNYTIIDNFANEWNSVPFTFTLTQDGYFYFTIRKDANTNINPSDYKAKILGQTYTIQFKDGDNPLTVYGGKVDLVSGVLTVDRAYVDLGTLNWALENGIFRLNESIGAKLTADTSAVANMLCSIYKTVSQNAMGSTSTDHCIAGLNWSNGVRVKDSNYTTVADFKTAMNGVQLVYELATPTTIQLTPTQVKSLLGSNNVWADTGEIIEGQYVVSKYSGMTAVIANYATSATTASKLGSSNVGSATQPIYLSAGTATACTYTLGKSVPSDAVFTDHYAWSDITGKATTLAGYGITDAKIASGTITLGSNTITPLTSSSTLNAAKLSGTIPSSCYTDTNNAVTQTPTDSTDKYYEILFSGTGDNIERTEGVKKSSYLRFNPNRKVLVINNHLYIENSSSGITSYMDIYTDSIHMQNDNGLVNISTSDGQQPSYISVGTVDPDGPIMGAALTTSDLELTSTWDGTNTSLKDALSNKLSLSGGTMTGTIITPADNSKGIKPASDGYGYVGMVGASFNKMVSTNFQGRNFYATYGNYTTTITPQSLSIVNQDVQTEEVYGTTTVNSTDITTSTTWDGTNTSLKTAVTDKLSKSSGTTIDNPISGSIAVTDSYYSKAPSVDMSKSNNNLSSDYYGLVDFRDKNKKRFGYIQFSARAAGGTDASLRAVNYASGRTTTEYTNTLTLATSKTGAYTYSVSSAANFRSAIGAAASSSIKTKENISDLTEDEALKLLKIRPVSFDYKQGFDIDNKYERNYGVIAEETLDIIPSVVNVPTTEGYEFDETKGTNQELITVDYAKFVPYLIKLVQMQQQEIDELKNR